MGALNALTKAPVSAKVGVAIIIIYIAAALLTPVIAPYGETEVVGEV